MTSEAASGREFQKIAILESRFEAQLLAAALDENAITYRMRSYGDTAYDGLFQFQMGWGQVEAPESCRETILAMLKDIRSSAEHLPDVQPDPDTGRDPEAAV